MTWLSWVILVAAYFICAAIFSSIVFQQTIELDPSIRILSEKRKMLKFITAAMGLFWPFCLAISLIGKIMSWVLKGK